MFSSPPHGLLSFLSIVVCRRRGGSLFFSLAGLVWLMEVFFPFFSGIRVGRNDEARSGKAEMGEGACLRLVLFCFILSSLQFYSLDSCLASYGMVFASKLTLILLAFLPLNLLG